MSHELTVVASNFNRFAGPTSHLLDLLNGCVDEGLREVAVVTHAGPLKPDFSGECRFPVHSILAGSASRADVRLLSLPVNIARLRKRLNRDGGVTFVNSSADLAYAARRATGRRLLIGYNVFLEAPPVGDPHRAEFGTSASARISAALDPWLARYCVDRIVCHSDFIRRIYVSIGIPEEAITIVPHAVDVRRIQKMATGDALWPLPGEGVLRVFLPRHLVPLKGIREALEACRRVSSRYPLQVCLVGRGPLENEVHSWAARSTPTLTVVHSPSTDLAAGLRVAAASDIVLAPSWTEAFGLEAAEAMALGRCVVASNKGGVADLVIDGVTGLAVPPRSVQELSAALERVAGDAGLRRRLGEAAARHVERNFGSRIIARRFSGWIDGAA